MKTVRDISISDFETLVSIISDIGIKEIDVLGGEPTLHPDFSKLIDIVYMSNLKTTISSNGSNIGILREISKKYNKNQIKLGISINIDSTDEELYKYIITYRPVLKSIYTKEQLITERIKKYPGIRYYLIFMDTLHKDDLKNSLPFYEYYIKLNQLKAIFDNLEGVFCSGFVSDINNYPFLQHVRCPAGTTKLSVMPDGSVYPCYLLFKNEEFRLGNILFDDFYKIWENPVLDFFRKFDKNSCINTKCELFSHCHGGCPAISFLISGDINAPDPRCVYQLNS
jgi:radical SAM protein with 4Fe4S-binding SPASM domain